MLIVIHFNPLRSFFYIQRYFVNGTQAHNQGGETPIQNFSIPSEKCVGHNLKLLDKV